MPKWLKNPTVVGWYWWKRQVIYLDGTGAYYCQPGRGASGKPGERIPTFEGLLLYGPLLVPRLPPGGAWPTTTTPLDDESNGVPIGVIKVNDGELEVRTHAGVLLAVEVLNMDDASDYLSKASQDAVLTDFRTRYPQSVPL